MSEATNDFGRTIESPANQMRILSEQWERLSRAIGNLFMPVISTILPYLNAVLMVLTEIINIIAGLLGFDTGDFDYFGGVADSVLDLEENLEGATESANKLKSGLRGFDKLNVITTPTSASSGSGAGTGIDPDIMDAFNDAFDEYNSKLEDVQMKAVKIRDAIMEWLGFTKEIDEVTGDVSFKFDHITGGTVLGALAVGGTIFTGVKTIFSILSKITGLKLTKPFTALLSSLGKVGSKLGAGVSLSGTTTIAGVLVYILAQFTSIRKETEKLANSIKSGNLSDFFKIDGIDDVVTKIYMLTSIFQGGLFPILGSLLEQFGVFDNVLQILGESLQPIIDKFTELGNYIKDELITLWKENLEPTLQNLQKVWEEDLEPVLNEFFSALEKIFIETGILQSGSEFFLSFLSNIFVAGISTALDMILTPFEVVFDTITGIIKGLSTTLDGIITFIDGVFAGDWDKAWKGIKQIFLGIWDTVTAPFRAIINGFLSTVESFANFFIDAINSIINALNKISFELPDWVPEWAGGGKKFGIDIKPVEGIKLPRLKTGIDFVPNDYYPAYLDYGERVLTKEENRDYMTNQQMNNNGEIRMNQTIIVQVGDEEVAKVVIDKLDDISKSNGKPITIGG